MGKKIFVNGDEAVAEGIRLAKPHVISAYPITPQTITVEKLSEFVEDGSLECEYIHVESEHSALACAIGVSSVGARAFTATSSQGLLYMAECMPYASGARMPIVMMNANRAIATPWNIYGDQMDSMFVLNSGWIQVYVEDAQEALDVMIQAYKIAEDSEVMTPFMVNLDGFVLTHTYELVDLPEQDEVDRFLPPIAMKENIMDSKDPKSLCISVGNDLNMEFKMRQERDLHNSKAVINRVDTEFGEAFGRSYGGLIDTYKCDDAQVILITTGSVTGTARIVVDDLRKQGHAVGLLKLRYLRPFPAEEISEAVKNVSAIGVVDKNISFGYEGTIFTNVNSALTLLEKLPVTSNFIGGIGGRDIKKSDIEDAYMKLLGKSENGSLKRVNYMNVKCGE